MSVVCIDFAWYIVERGPTIGDGDGDDDFGHRVLSILDISDPRKRIPF